MLFKSFVKEEKKKCALAGSRTRIYCLEGSNADRYTTNALLWNVERSEPFVPSSVVMAYTC